MIELSYDDIRRIAEEAPLQAKEFPITLLGFIEARNEMSCFNLPVDTLVVSDSIWHRICDPNTDEFAKVIEPETDKAKISQGVIGVMYGMELVWAPSLEKDTVCVVAVSHIMSGRNLLGEAKNVLRFRMKAS
jgi:hypothetical protein